MFSSWWKKTEKGSCSGELIDNSHLPGSGGRRMKREELLSKTSKSVRAWRESGLKGRTVLPLGLEAPEVRASRARIAGVG